MKPYPSHKKTEYQKIIDDEASHYSEAEKNWKRKMTALKKGYVYAIHDPSFEKEDKSKVV